MVDTFDVQPLRGAAMKTTNFAATLGSLFSNGIYPTELNDFNIIDQVSPALDIKVDTGRCMIDGIFVSLTALSDAKTLTDAATNSVFITIQKNASQRITGAAIEVRTAGNPTDEFIKIGEVVTAAGDITSISKIGTTFVGIQQQPGIGNTLFGDGSDGDVVISSNTTLTEEKFYNSLVIDASFNLTANEPMLVFVKELCIINGNIHMDGKGGAAGSAATIGPSAGGPAGLAGPSPPPPATPGSPGGAGRALGGLGGSGTTGIGATSPGTTGSVGGVGGAGGAGTPGPFGKPGGAGGPGTPGTAAGAPGGLLSRRVNNILLAINTPTVTSIGAGGTGGGAGGRGGGGGGGGGGSNFNGAAGGAGGGGGATGGAGGAGGGTLILVAKNIIINSGGRISSDGLVGAVGAANPGTSLNGAAGAAHPAPSDGGGGGGGGGSPSSGGGGGHGGNGGHVIIIYNRLTNNGTLRAVGGAGGGPGPSPGATGGTGGAAPAPNPGVAGTPSPGAGTPGPAGSTGGAGIVKQIST